MKISSKELFKNISTRNYQNGESQLLSRIKALKMQEIPLEQIKILLRTSHLSFISLFW